MNSFIGVCMRLDDGTAFCQILIPKPDGSFEVKNASAVPTNPGERKRALNTNTLWQDAIQNAKSSCLGNVNFGQVVDPVTSVAKTTDIVKLANKAKQSREYLFVAYELTKQSRRPRGFLMAKREPEGIYLDVICAKSPQGTLLMQALLSRADEDNVSVTLSALPNVLMQYPKFGFEFRKNCTEPATNLAPDLLARLNARVRSKEVPTSLDSQQDPDWKELLQILHSSGLNAAKQSPCDDPNLDSNAIGANFCGRDGYSMVRCKPGINNALQMPLIATSIAAVAAEQNRDATQELSSTREDDVLDYSVDESRQKRVRRANQFYASGEQDNV